MGFGMMFRMEAARKRERAEHTHRSQVLPAPLSMLTMRKRLCAGSRSLPSDACCTCVAHCYPRCCQMLEAAKQAHEKTIAYACHHLRYVPLPVLPGLFMSSGCYTCAAQLWCPRGFLCAVVLVLPGTRCTLSLAVRASSRTPLDMAMRCMRTRASCSATPPPCPTSSPPSSTGQAPPATPATPCTPRRMCWSCVARRYVAARTWYPRGYRTIPMIRYHCRFGGSARVHSTGIPCDTSLSESLLTCVECPRPG
jgi:hypothetical protein